MPAHTLGGVYFCLNLKYIYSSHGALPGSGASLPVMFSTPTTLGLPQAFSAVPRATKPSCAQKRTVTCVSSSEKNQKSPPNWPLRVPEGKEINRPEQDACFDRRAGFGGPLPVTLPRGTWIDGCMTRGHSQAQEDEAPGRRGSTNKLRAHFPPADGILRSHPFSPFPDTGFTARIFHYKGSASFPRILMPGAPHCPSVPRLGGNDAWAEGAPRSPGPGLQLCGQR